MMYKQRRVGMGEKAFEIFGSSWGSHLIKTYCRCAKHTHKSSFLSLKGAVRLVSLANISHTDQEKCVPSLLTCSRILSLHYKKSTNAARYNTQHNNNSTISSPCVCVYASTTLLSCSSSFSLFHAF